MRQRRGFVRLLDARDTIIGLQDTRTEPIRGSDIPERLLRVYFGPKVNLRELTFEQLDEAAAFLERLAEEVMLLDIEQSLRAHASPRAFRAITLR